MIELRGVSVTAPVLGEADKTLLHDVTLTLPERRIAVVGANGSGKSTFLRLINGLVEPARGHVLVEGLDVARNGRAVRRLVGFTFADALAQLIMVTPQEDVELSLRPIVRDRGERTKQARALLEAQGLGHVARSSIYALSGGERQLAALTSVLAVEPHILVCDEPTTLLDLRNRNRMIAVLLGVAQQLVYATHDLDFAAAADRALWIENGRVAADGEPAAVIDAYRRSVA